MIDVKITKIAGSSVEMKFIVTKDGTPFITLSSCEIYFKLATHGDITSQVSKSTSDFTVADNTATIKLLSTDTANLSGAYEYIITFSDALQNTDKFKGVINFEKDIV